MEKNLKLDKITREDLDNKLDKELDEYKKDLLTKDKQMIFDSAYEFTIKNELVDLIKCYDLHEREIEALYNRDNLLSEMYEDWLDTDVNLDEPLMSSLDDTIINTTKYYIRNNKNNER